MDQDDKYPISNPLGEGVFERRLWGRGLRRAGTPAFLTRSWYGEQSQERDWVRGASRFRLVYPAPPGAAQLESAWQE